MSMFWQRQDEQRSHVRGTAYKKQSKDLVTWRTDCNWDSPGCTTIVLHARGKVNASSSHWWQGSEREREGERTGRIVPNSGTFVTLPYKLAYTHKHIVRAGRGAWSVSQRGPCRNIGTTRIIDHGKHVTCVPDIVHRPASRPRVCNLTLRLWGISSLSRPRNRVIA